MNYIKFTEKKQGLTPLKSARTHHSECRPLSRCNNYKKCKACHTIYKNKQIKKLSSHLDEISIREYKYKQYLVFTSADTHRYEDYKNSDLDNFLRELISTKRNKSGILSNAQYLAIKEISFSSQLGYNPHYNFIYLSNKKFIQSKEFKRIASKYNIKVHVTDIYQTERSYLKSIKKIINYSFKYDDKRSTIEKQTELTKHKQDVKKSNLFISSKFYDLHKRLYKYILELNAHYRAKKNKALSTYRRYNKSKPSTKVKMLKSLNKKLKKIQSAKEYFTNIAKKRFYKELCYDTNLKPHSGRRTRL